MTPDYPLTFQPILKPKVWGGRRFEAFGKNLSDDESIGESWEIADLPATVSAERSVVANGSLTGRTLRELIDNDRDAVLGDVDPTTDGGFPLLIKYLDARENLSVQVHPDAAHAAAHPDAHLKSEAWYVVAAESDSVIYKGVKPHVLAADFAAHIEEGSVVDDLVAVPVRPGDIHYLPSGTCHALGAGVLVAEVQTPSDTTFRVFDWNRGDRELHVEQALQCIAFGESSEANSQSVAGDQNGSWQELVRCEHFVIERTTAERSVEIPIPPECGPIVWMMTRGRGVVTTDKRDDVALSAGSTVLFPAALRRSAAQLEPGSVVLQITLP